MSTEAMPAQGPVDVNVSRHDCYTEDGVPIKCWKCGSTEQREVVRSMVDVLYGQGPVCEYEVFCAECGTGIGYWAHGSFDPGYVRDMAANVQAEGAAHALSRSSLRAPGSASRDSEKGTKQ